MPDSPRDRELLHLPGFLESLRSGDSDALDRLMDGLWAPLVRFAGREIRRHDGQLHDLFLEDGHTEGPFQHPAHTFLVEADYPYPVGLTVTDPDGLE